MILQGLQQNQLALNTKDSLIDAPAETASITAGQKAYATPAQQITSFDDEAFISSSSKAKLAQLKDAQELSKLVPQEETTSRSQRVQQLKALVSEGRIGSYLKNLDNTMLADNMLTHLMQPSF